MKNQVLIDIKMLIACIVSGGNVREFVSHLDGNWIKISKSLGTDMLSEAIKENPFEELTKEENKQLVMLTHAGELGGVLEICLKRFLDHIENKNVNPVKEFALTVGMLICSGVPLLTSIRETDIDEKYKPLKDTLYADLKEGGSFSLPFKNYLTDQEVSEMIEAENNGSLPEYLLSLKSSLV